MFKELNYLDELFQNVGEEEEWLDMIMDEDYALAATVYDYLGVQVPADVRMVVCRLLVRMSKMDEQIGVHIVTERWGELSFLIDQISMGIAHAAAMPEEGDAEEEERMQAFFAFGSCLLRRYLQLLKIMVCQMRCCLHRTSLSP